MSIKQAIEALQCMVDEKADYMLRNHLGNPYGEHSVKQAEAAIADLRSMPAEPLFYYRPCMDGLYEGPHHARSVLGKMLREERPNDWHPLYATPHTAPLSDAEIEQAVKAARHPSRTLTPTDLARAIEQAIGRASRGAK